jgi:hypothetical protein
MRIAAYFFLVLGVIYLGSAIDFQIQGSALEPGGKIPEHILTPGNQSDDFHNAIIYYWVRSLSFFIIGLILLFVHKALEKSDPLSPDFGDGGTDDKPEAGDEQK